jgi:hypothetical protein
MLKATLSGESRHPDGMRNSASTAVSDVTTAAQRDNKLQVRFARVAKRQRIANRSGATPLPAARSRK